MRERLVKLRSKLDAAGIEGFLITNPENRYYLSGFTGTSGFLLVTSRESVLVTDGRYTEQARAECPKLEVVEAKRPWPEGVIRVVREAGLRSLGAESGHLSYARWQELVNGMDGTVLVPVRNLVEELRMVKEPGEITLIREAVRLVDAVFADCLPGLRAGVREREWALELEFALRRRGAERAAFDFIVASGWRSALPHGVATEKVIQPGELVVIDCGGVLQRYCADFTRTVVTGAAADWQEEVYRAVLAAQKAAIAAVRPGAAAGEVDRAARTVLAEYGYAEAFVHSTGHGLGLAVHEEPRLAEGVEAILEPGMVVTVEPGVYLPGRGGVRIEDVVVVTDRGAEVLTATPKDVLPVVG